MVLRVELTGAGRVDVYRTKATGARISVQGRQFAGADDQPAVVEFEVGLEPFEDGGWIWFDITTDTEVTVHQRRLVCARARPGHGQRRRRHPDLQPARGLRQRAGRTDRRIRWWTR